MNLDTIDWRALERLRTAFLAGTAGATDYWLQARDLESYDQTFAQRIGWKWDGALAELHVLKWSPPPGAVLDWGCGSGIAGRAFLDHYGTANITELCLYDRSTEAVSYAAKRAREKYPALEIVMGAGTGTNRGTLLISHVINELSPEQVTKLLELVGSFTSVLWVEPGTYEASASLVGVRERLRSQFQIVAPCTHQGACGLLNPDNSRHWCHHFAAPPPGVFTDGDWAKFANLVGIDLGALPFSYLVLDKRPLPVLPPDPLRVIGTTRLSKHEALLFGCDANIVGDRKVSRRLFPEAYRLVKKDRLPTLVSCQCQGNAVTQLHFPKDPSKDNTED